MVRKSNIRRAVSETEKKRQVIPGETDNYGTKRIQGENIGKEPQDGKMDKSTKEVRIKGRE